MKAEMKSEMKAEWKEVTKNVMIKLVILVVGLCLMGCNSTPKFQPEMKSNKLESPDMNPLSGKDATKSPSEEATKESALVFEDPVVEERFKIALGIENRSLYPSDLAKIKCMRIETDNALGYEYSYDSYEYGDDVDDFMWHKFYMIWDREDTDWDHINNIKTWNDIRHFANLEYLDMNTSNVVLNYMYFKFDNLEPIGELTNLKYFAFEKTIFTDLSPLNNCRKMQYLYLPGAEGNNLNALKGLTELREFTYNSLHEDDESQRLHDISGLSECTKMERLDLADNVIDDISALSNMPNLAYLDLSSNDISDYSPLEKTGNKMTLVLNNNDFANSRFGKGFKQVENLNLTFSDNVDIREISTFSNIKVLNVSYTELVDITSITAMTELIELDLSYNEIVDMTPLASLIHLEVLDMRDNPMETNVDFKGLTKLKELFLDEENRAKAINVDPVSTNIFK